MQEILEDIPGSLVDFWMALGPKKLHLSDGNLSPPASMATKSGPVIEAEDPWLNQLLWKKITGMYEKTPLWVGPTAPETLHVVTRDNLKDLNRFALNLPWFDRSPISFQYIWFWCKSTAVPELHPSESPSQHKGDICSTSHLSSLQETTEAVICQGQGTCFYAWERSGECCLEWTEQKKSVCRLLSFLHSAFLASVGKGKRNTSNRP